MSNWPRFLPESVQRPTRCGKNRSSHGRPAPTERIFIQSLERRTLLSAGVLDPTFGAGGIANYVTNSPISAAALAPDSKIVFAGPLTSAVQGSFGISRTNSNGSIDTTFGTDGSAVIDFGTPYVNIAAVAVQADGRVVVAGTESTTGYQKWVVARLNVDGTSDTTFGSGGKIITDFGVNAAVAAMTIQSDGKIVVVGWEGSSYPGQLTLLRYNTDGSLDATFGANGRATITGNSDPSIPSSVAIASTGKIVVGGEDANGAASLAQFNSNGTLDSSFGSGGAVESGILIGLSSTRITSIALQRDNGIIATLASASGVNGPIFMQKFTNAGAVDSGFGPPGGVEVNSFGNSPRVVCQADGKPVVAETAVVNFPALLVTRFNTDGSPDPTFGSDGSGSATFSNFGYKIPAAVFIQPNNQVVVAGNIGSPPFPNNGGLDRIVGGPIEINGVGALTIGGFPTYTPTGLGGTETVTVKDAAGAVVTGFLGTVHFTSTDSNALLPADYTFTAADQGVHTFNVTFETPGTQTVSVTDANGFTIGQQTGIVIHNSVSDFVPMPEPTSFVFDPTRNRLYAPNAQGSVDVYDINTQTLLPPIVLGGTLAGADITPDGHYLYVTAGFPYPHVQQIIYKVNLNDGTVSKIPAPGNYSTSIAIGSNGIGLIAYANSSGPIYRIDTATDTITPVNDLPGITSQTFNAASVSRSANRSLLVLAASSAAQTYGATYIAATDSFGSYTTNLGGGSVLGLPINTNGTLIAQVGGSIKVTNSNWNSVATFGGPTGAIFDPNQNLLYSVANPNSSVGPPPGINVYNPTTGALVGSAPWTLQVRAPLPAGTFSPNVDPLAITPDSRLLFIGTAGGFPQWPGGIYLFHLGTDPVADPGGPYTVAEGGSITLSGTGSFDLYSSINQYEWDLNYDGVNFNPTATGATPTFSAASLAGPVSRRIALRATDAAGHSSISYTGLTVTNVTPTLTATGIAGAWAGSSYTLNLSYSNVSTDPAKSWTIDWGDGGPLQTISGSATSATHIFPLPPDQNPYRITASVLTAGGTFSAKPLAVTVVPSPTIDANHTLDITGSAAVDAIALSSSGNSLVVNVNGAVLTVSQSTFSGIYISALTANDTININASIPPGVIDLGDGDDILNFTGSVLQVGTLVLMGGTGNDTFNLSGSGSRVSADGGSGNDTLSLNALAPFNSSEVFAITSTSISVTMGAASSVASFANMEAVNAEGNSESDTFNLAAPSGPQFSLDGRGGNDVFNINQASINQPIKINSASFSANSTLNIASSASPLLAVSVSSGTLTLSPGRGTGIRCVNFASINVAYNSTFTLASSAALGDYSRHGRRTVANISTVSSNSGMVVNGVLDIGDNDLILHYDSSYRYGATSQMQLMLSSGFEGGAWNGSQINSSAAAYDAQFGAGTRALGYADNNDLGYSTFDGVDTSDGNEVLVKFTYYGDSDLNGQINGTDFSLFGAGRSGAGTGWDFGDYDYSGGRPNGTDFSLFGAGLSSYRQFGAL